VQLKEFSADLGFEESSTAAAEGLCAQAPALWLARVC
jgi:hypothetical protein